MVIQVSTRTLVICHCVNLVIYNFCLQTRVKIVLTDENTCLIVNLIGLYGSELKLKLIATYLLESVHQTKYEQQNDARTPCRTVRTNTDLCRQDTYICRNQSHLCQCRSKWKNDYERARLLALEAQVQEWKKTALSLQDLLGTSPNHPIPFPDP